MIIHEHFPGFALKKDQVYELQPGDVLEILLGKYFYEIIFETDIIAKQSDIVLIKTPVTSVVDTNFNGEWESVDKGNLLVFTPNGVKASSKVKNH